MMESTVGVAVFVLRRTPAHDTEILLLKPAGGPLAGTWVPVAGDLAGGECESDGALRQLAQRTGLRPLRLYAAPFHWSNTREALGPRGRVGVFVAWVAPGATVEVAADHGEFAWCPLREAGSLLHGDFVRHAPDEALRVL